MGAYPRVAWRQHEQQNIMNIYAYLCIAAGQKILDHLAKIQKMEQRVKDQEENDQDQTNSSDDGKTLMSIHSIIIQEISYSKYSHSYM